MRLLITGVNYAPEETGIAPYTTGLAEHLVQRGHQVTVITGVPSYPQWRVYPDYRKVLLRREVRAGVELWRVRNYVPRRQSTLQRGLYEASFLLGGLAKLSASKPDAVLGVVPSLSGGMLAGRRPVAWDARTAWSSRTSSARRPARAGSAPAGAAG